MNTPTDAPDPARIKRGVVELFVLNGISFATIAVTYLAYSRLLAPHELGIYGAALLVGSVSTVVIEQGVKNALIKAEQLPDHRHLGALLVLFAGAAVGLSLALFLAEPAIVSVKPSMADKYSFLARYAVAHLLSFPLTVIPTALLERGFRYRRIAIIESTALVLERALPAIFMLAFAVGLDSFVWSIAIGRLFRVCVLFLTHPVRPTMPTVPIVRALRSVFSEGVWLQLASIVALARDNLHVLAVGPMFGDMWIGYYAWGLQLCMMASQAFVQVSGRIALPIFARETVPARRWAHCVLQIEWLTIATAPVLCALLVVMPRIDAEWFHGKWAPALPLLVLLFLRMLPGVATTPLAALAIVQGRARAFARVNLLWTVVEVAAAVAALELVGPHGLAWSWAVVIWLGLWQLGTAVGDGRFSTLVRPVLMRPSLWFGIAMSAGFALLGMQLSVVLTIFVASVIVLVCYSTEPRVRALVRHRIVP